MLYYALMFLVVGLIAGALGVWDRRDRRSDRVGPVPHRSRLDRRAHDRWSPGAPVTASYFPVQNTDD